MRLLTDNKPVHRKLSGGGEFRLPSGQLFVLCADDAKIEAELRQRGGWQEAADMCKVGRTAALVNRTDSGIDVFVWFGHKDDGGLSWFSFPGARMESPDVRRFLACMATSLFGMAPAQLEGELDHGRH